MALADEPLLRAIVTAHHDPDPERAFRYTPFLHGIVRRREAGDVTVLAGRGPRCASIRVAPLAAAQRLLLQWRPASAPCCMPACC